MFIRWQNLNRYCILKLLIFLYYSIYFTINILALVRCTEYLYMIQCTMVKNGALCMCIYFSKLLLPKFFVFFLRPDSKVMSFRSNA